LFGLVSVFRSYWQNGTIRTRANTDWATIGVFLARHSFSICGVVASSAESQWHFVRNRRSFPGLRHPSAAIGAATRENQGKMRAGIFAFADAGTACPDLDPGYSDTICQEVRVRAPLAIEASVVMSEPLDLSAHAASSSGFCDGQYVCNGFS
jgi:hypothetical protein